MSIYVCDRCHTIENSALGMFNRARAHKRWFGDAIQEGEKLCSSCAPSHFVDGSPNRKGGKWHDAFNRELATPDWIHAQGDGFKMTAGGHAVLRGQEPALKLALPLAEAKNEL